MLGSTGIDKDYTLTLTLTFNPNPNPNANTLTLTLTPYLSVLESIGVDISKIQIIWDFHTVSELSLTGKQNFRSVYLSIYLSIYPSYLSYLSVYLSHLIHPST